MHSPTRMIACAVFAPVLEHLELENRYPHLTLTLLPSYLHLRPHELKDALRQEISSGKKRNGKVICLYGDCMPDMADFCSQQGVIKIPGFHCFEMLLGTQRYQQIINEMPGTYFLERDLILNFGEYCLEPLELHDEEIRKSFFENYERVVYLRQPSDPDLLFKVSELATFLQLSFELRDADYSHLEKILNDLL